MAWKAECNRRKWYCILGWDAVSWFSEYSYNEWRRSLTPAQIRKLEEYEKKQKEKIWMFLTRQKNGSIFILAGKIQDLLPN